MRQHSRSGRKQYSSWVRWVDRWLGIPALFFLSCFRRRGSLPAKIDRIALLKADGMGDFVLMTGLLKDLREKFPHAILSVWCGGTVLPLARELAVLDEVHAIDFNRPLSAWRALRAWKADVMIDSGQWSRAEAILSAVSGARFVIGFATPGQHRDRLFDARIEHRNDRHELENFRSLLAPLGIVSHSEPHLELRAGKSESAAEGSPYIVFHMWPSGLTQAHLKQWPAKRWEELATACIQQGRRIVLTGGKQDAARSEEWLAKFGEKNWVENKAGTTIRETIAVLRQAEAVVSVNTGVMHLAAAVGAPTIGLNGPCSGLRWGPVGADTIGINTPAPDGGYLSLGFEYPRDAAQRRGLNTVAAEDVMRALSGLTDIAFERDDGTLVRTR